MSAPPSHVVMLGLMGAGKTTVGRALARVLGWPFSDSDQWIREHVGASVREIDEDRGAGAMHRLEAEHVLAALAAPGPSVISAAASVVDDERCLAELLRGDVFAVWLKAPPETLARRFASSSHRPVLAQDTERLLAEQLAQRGERFAEVARIELSAGDATPDELVEAVRSALACR